MNRNLQGEWLSREELIEMAFECGALTLDKFTSETKTHVFWDMTREHRLAMFSRGELILDTRPRPEKPAVRPTVDRELLAFLGKEVVTGF